MVLLITTREDAEGPGWNASFLGGGFVQAAHSLRRSVVRQGRTENVIKKNFKIKNPQ